MSNFEKIKEMRDDELATIQEILSTHTSDELDDSTIAYLDVLWEAYNSHDKLCKMLNIA